MKHAKITVLVEQRVRDCGAAFLSLDVQQSSQGHRRQGL